jgi:hypothetical protein
MRNVSEKIFVEQIRTHILYSVIFSLENRAVYEIIWTNMAEPDRPHMTIWHRCIVCWIPRAINTQSEYVILIAFLLQRWYGCTSMSRCACIACLVRCYRRWYIQPKLRYRRLLKTDDFLRSPFGECRDCVSYLVTTAFFSSPCN